MKYLPVGTIARSVKGAGVLILAATLGGADWSGCQDDLDTLRRRASEASDAAEHVKQAADDFETKRREWQDCRAFPSIYDLMRDGCRSYAWDYEQARDEFESAKSSLESELDSVDSALRSTGASCGYAFSGGRSTTSTSTGSADPVCRLLQRYKSRVPTPNLMEMCRKSKGEQECRKCLE
jgi:hypothetical protein